MLEDYGSVIKEMIKGIETVEKTWSDRLWSVFLQFVAIAGTVVATILVAKFVGGLP